MKVMNRWREEEDNILVNEVLDSYKTGTPIEDAFVTVSKKLNRSVGACRNRWYVAFQEEYSQEIENLKKRYRRTNNEYVGEWSLHEEEKLLNLMVDFLSQGLKISEALEKSSNIMGRTIKSCEGRWYQNILKKNRLYIQSFIDQNKSKNKSLVCKVVRSWDKEQERIVVNMMKNILANGFSNKEAFNKIAERFNLKLDTVTNYWYTHLYPEHKEEIKNIIDNKNYQDNNQDNNQIGTWDKEKKYQLYKIVVSHKEEGQDVNDALSIAATLLHRSKNECIALWATEVSYNKEFKERYNKEKLEQEEIKVTTQEETKDQDELVLSKTEEFINMINKLVERNKELELENKELKEKLKVKNKEEVMMEEFKKNYDELLNVFEKAQKIIADSNVI